MKSIKKIIDEFEGKNRSLLEKFLALDKELKELLEKGVVNNFVSVNHDKILN